MCLAYRAKPQRDATSLHSNYCPTHFVVTWSRYEGGGILRAVDVSDLSFQAITRGKDPVNQAGLDENRLVEDLTAMAGVTSRRHVHVYVRLPVNATCSFCWFPHLHKPLKEHPNEKGHVTQNSFVIPRQWVGRNDSIHTWLLDQHGDRAIQGPIDEWLRSRRIPRAVKSFPLHVLEGVAFLDESTIAHLDLKPGHIALFDGYPSATARLSTIDFGLSIFLRSKETMRPPMKELPEARENIGRGIAKRSAKIAKDDEAQKFACVTDIGYRPNRLLSLYV
ncbi:hypothetical protein BJV78DRAFT_1156199 [Lactifluus subvellereus]|nr:hypothetical protein BJV78DRAFT_1156199 [Lactifluus subvellereus]